MNFLTEYIRYCGTSEVPPVFTLWCGLSALAAAAADRVWIEKHPGEKLVPNLYVFLLGPSGIGKGQAIGQAFRLLQQVPAIRTLRGKITAAALCDLLAGPQAPNGHGGVEPVPRRHPVAHGKLLLVTPELALSVGRGPLADDLVKLLTELYTGGDYEFHEQTRTHGLRTFRGHCLGGDTEVLTPQGWVALSALTDGETVAQWDLSGNLSWSDNTVVHRVPWTEDVLHVSSRTHDCLYTNDHRMILASNWGKVRPVVERADRAAKRSKFDIPTAGILDGTVSIPWIRFLVAAQADGAIQNRRVYFGFKRTRKVERLHQLCETFGIPLKELRVKGNRYRRFVTWGPIVESVIRQLGPDKRFGSWLLQTDIPTREQFIAELEHWDGHRTKKGLVQVATSHEDVASWIATVGATIGRGTSYGRAGSRLWFAYIRKRQPVVSINREHIQQVPSPGRMYCVTTKTGFFIARSHRRTFITGNCLSWLAGTTREWLRDCITKDAVEGGFFARVAAVAAQYDLDRRIAVPSVPSDWRAVGDDLVGHLDRIASVGGALRLDTRARGLLDDWYLTRPSPDDEALIPTWKREHDLVLKLAALAALADDPATGGIAVDHVVAAQRWAATVTHAIPALVEYVALTKETDGLRAVREAVRAAGTIHHVALARAMGRTGMTADVLGRFVRTLREGGYLRREVGAKGAVVYVWQERTQSMGEEEDE